VERSNKKESVMMKINNIVFLNIFLLMQSYFVFSHENSCNNNSKNNTPQAEIHVNGQYDTSPKNSWHFSTQIREVPNYSNMQRANYTIVAHESPELQHYFYHTIAAHMYDATIKNHCCILPGYQLLHGLRSHIDQLSQFCGTDTVLASSFNTRLETYCNRIEAVVFSGKESAFCDDLSHMARVELVKIYADFLKEFYANAAPYIFYDQSQQHPLMQKVMPVINWSYYDGDTVTPRSKTLEQRKAALVNGNLGVVYKALHAGDFEKANTVGNEMITVGVGKKAQAISVFQRYPALHQKVTQARDAYIANMEQKRLAQEKDAQQKAVAVQGECTNHLLQKSHLDTVQQRFDAATRTIINSQYVKQIHNVNALQANYFDTEHMTSDRKGILLNGNHLQHHLVDEAITVVDTVISNDLTEKMQGAVVDFANASLSLNKTGDVVMASRTLDACWALIDFAKDAAQYTYSALSTHVPLIAKGACDGVCESLHGAMHTVCHPVEAAQDVVQSFVVAGYCLGKIAYASCVLEVATDLLETDPKYYEQMIGQYAIDPQTLAAIYEYAQKNNVTEDVARVGTKAVVDMMLLHGVTKVVSAIATESLPTFLSCMRKSGESAEVAMTAEGVPVRCAEEVACLMEKMESANVKVSAGTFEAGTKNVAAKKYGKQGSPYQKISKSTQYERPLDRLKGKDLLGIDNIVMSGYGPLPESISLANYKHYLQPELRITSKGKIKPSGWHHDPGRRMEAIKRINGHKIEIENYKKHASGIYEFDWGVEGMRKKTSTFFPHSWSRELIQSKIREAYKYARKYKIDPEFQNRTNNFSLFGFTKDGIKIEMIINQQGIIISAYPCM
jgi:hypothetical protein